MLRISFSLVLAVALGSHLILDIVEFDHIDLQLIRWSWLRNYQICFRKIFENLILKLTIQTEF